MTTKTAAVKALRKTLAPYARAYETMIRHVEGLDDVGLQHLRAACEWPTHTNCGWQEFGVAKALLNFITTEQQRRAYATRRKTVDDLKMIAAKPARRLRRPTRGRP